MSSRASCLPSALLLLVSAGSAAAQTSVLSLLSEARKLLPDKPAEARSRLERALELDPRSAEAHYLLGTVEESASNLAGARREYEEAIRLAPRMAVAHDRLGFVRGLQGETE